MVLWFWTRNLGWRSCLDRPPQNGPKLPSGPPQPTWARRQLGNTNSLLPITRSNFSQPVTMPALNFHTECLGLEDPETPENIRKEWGSVFAILRDYVQPDSTLSLYEAVDRVAEFYTDGYQKSSPINHTLIILGDQIPYDNPAYTKLAYFFPALGKAILQLT